MARFSQKFACVRSELLAAMFCFEVFPLSESGTEVEGLFLLGKRERNRGFENLSPKEQTMEDFDWAAIATHVDLTPCFRKMVFCKF